MFRADLLPRGCRWRTTTGDRARRAGRRLARARPAAPAGSRSAPGSCTASGMPDEQIARRSVAFFVIKSSVNFVAVAVIGTLMAVGLLGPHQLAAG